MTPLASAQAEAPLALLPTDHAILRRVAREVPDLFEPEFQHFLDRLIVAGEHHQGVGIAAPQVGVSLRAFIMASRPNSRYPDAPAMVPTAVIHPRILWRSEELVKDWEGCLSVPGLRGQVPRAQSLVVAYFDRQGVYHQEKLQGFLARLFQHEFDHLQGVLYPERMDAGDKALTLDEFTERTGIKVGA